MALAEGAGISLWDATAEEHDVAGELDGGLRTELAIVGGGFTGLSTALHAAGRGIACQVLEAQRLGHGGSGRNVGLVNAGMWLPPQDVRARLGAARGDALVQLLAQAPDYVMALIERHQIRCEARRDGTIHAAHAPGGYDELARRAAAWQALGAPVELLSRQQAAAKIGSDAFYGGLLDRRAGTVNPMGYVRGLARAALSAGAGIATGVTVRTLRRDGGDWVLETDRGSVRARSVVLATNAYTDDLWPGLKRTFTPIHYFQVATEPLGADASAILAEGQGLWDTGRIMFSLRRDAHDRLIIGSMGSVIGGTDGVSRRWAARKLRRLFPGLGPVRFAAAWHGTIALTPDHLPRIHRLAENLYTPIGYNGRGITTGTVFGRAMADLLSGGREDALPLPITNPRTVAAAPIMSRVYATAFAANQRLR